ncbi:MAG: hypothetical protein WCT14_05450 [Treponemataceae bacterium]
MAEKKRRNWIVLGSIAFVVYVFAASMPIGTETVLSPAWLRQPKEPVSESRAKDDSVPFHTNKLFGYFNPEGDFTLVKTRNERTVISDRYWADFEKTPASIDLYGSDGKLRYSIAERGYPYFADNRIFIVGVEQNQIIALDDAGKGKWRHDFPSIITCADAAAGFSVFGLLDGSIEVLDAKGSRLFAFEPGGSRLPVIAAVRLSSDGKKVAIISGVDPQRFILLERSGQTYKVAHHEYMDRGFRRPVLASFIAGDKFVAFERENGLAIYDVSARKTVIVDTKGRIVDFEDQGARKRFFLIVDNGANRELIGINLPNEVFMRAPFLSSDTFITRRNDRIYLGGNGFIAALDIKNK